MRIRFSSLVLAPAVLAAVAFTANTAMAESRINVPFSFTVGGKNCPAGVYKVQEDIQGNSVKLVGPSQSFTWGIHPGDPKPSDQRVILQFDDLGTDHVLRSIQFGPLVTSRLDTKVKNADITQTESVHGQ